MKKFFLAILIICLMFQIKSLIKNVSNMNFGAEIDLQIVKGIETDEKIIALTFDDGPHPKQTPKVLSVLKENDSTATFFMLGKNIELYPEVAKRVIENGNEAGNHTFSHIDIRNNSYGALKKEFEKTQDIIYEVTGKKPVLFRPPFGRRSDKLKNLVDEYGCKVVLWSEDQDSKDWNCPGRECIVKTVIENISPGDIILLHDYVVGKSETASALESILPELKSRGYKIVTVSKLLSTNKALRGIKK